jgi:holo-[acyl-carrier protein] synthase
VILGIGVDLCHVTRVRRSIKRFGERFTSKFCTVREREWIDSSCDPPLFYAQSFAAKEALAKALGSGFGEGVDAVNIELIRIKPPIEVALTGAAADKLNNLVPKWWIVSVHVSIGTCLDFASASAVISASLPEAKIRSKIS